MVRAIWNEAVIAESDQTVVVEGNHYFPPGSVVPAHLRSSASMTTCPWKGVAGYYDVVVEGDVNPGAAWYYPHPEPAAREIADHVAFWKGVKVVDDAASGGFGHRLVDRLRGR